MIEDGKILRNIAIKGDFRLIEFQSPEIAAKVLPGQFAHIKIHELRDRVLRRPFSIYDTDKNGRLSVVFKVVGEGTGILAGLKEGATCNIIGPLGKPFSLPESGKTPVIIAGGYGCAATYILAKKSPSGIILIGARNEGELILVKEFESLGFEVRISTDDGSAGKKGLVTDLLKALIKEKKDRLGYLSFYGCGPHGMLTAAGKIIASAGLDGELSMDHLMCCGIGACFACVQKIKDKSSPEGWRYARTCKEGPVFKVSDVIF